MATITSSCCATASPRCRSSKRTCTSRCHCETSPRASPCCTAGICGRVAPVSTIRTPRFDDFRTQTRDLYVPAGDVSFWQAALRDTEDDLYAPVREAISARTPLSVDLLYGDHEGGQRTITRFYMLPRTREQDDQPWLWMCSTSRHWNLDRADPR